MKMKRSAVITLLLSLVFIQAVENPYPFEIPKDDFENELNRFNEIVKFEKEYKETLTKIKEIGAPDSLVPIIYEKSVKYGFDPLMITKLIKAESNFNPEAKSCKNALGLVQTLPLTCENLGLEYTTDPSTNIDNGLYILSLMQIEVNGSLELALLYYNGGVKGYRTRFNQSYADNILKG